MQEIQILYAVTGVVIALLVVWVGYVLVKAPRLARVPSAAHARGSDGDAKGAPGGEARGEAEERDGTDTGAG
jgi:hypothetical protein